MFAGAAREVVFSNPAVIRRVNHDFVPVALKAALVNDPPAGAEGRLYAEIGRSKPAPQGICTINSAGKVLAWALSFDDEPSILTFLDHVAERYQQSADASSPVSAERFRKFPSQPLPAVADRDQPLVVPMRHGGEPCPGQSKPEHGAIVGRIVGRALDAQGKPVSDTVRQEHYMEARFELPASMQQQLAFTARRAAGKRFPLPDEFARRLVGSAYLGQLDVNPLGDVPGSRNDHRHWRLTGKVIASEHAELARIEILGESDVAGGQDTLGRRTDGRFWQHRVTLRWQGYADIQGDRVQELAMLASGNERLLWGNPQFQRTSEAHVQHLMAGHPIDLRGGVRYGLLATARNVEDDK